MCHLVQSLPHQGYGGKTARDRDGGASRHQCIDKDSFVITHGKTALPRRPLGVVTVLAGGGAAVGDRVGVDDGRGGHVGVVVAVGASAGSGRRM